MDNIPNIGTVWKHYNGCLYRVILISNEHTERPEKYPVTVVYQSGYTGLIWSRPLSKWHDSMTLVGVACKKCLGLGVIHRIGGTIYPCEVCKGKGTS